MRISDWSSDVCSSDLERWLAKIALAPVAYGHFFVEHNRGHHVRVATPEDPATSRFGEHFHEFLQRPMIGRVKSAWELERKDRKSVVEGKSVSGRVNVGGRRVIKKKKKKNRNNT